MTKQNRLGYFVALAAAIVIGVGGCLGQIAVLDLASTSLSITTQPSSTVASGVVFAQQPVLQLLDTLQRPWHKAGAAVSVTLLPQATGTLGGTLTAMTNSNGVATFTNLSITGPLGDQTLSFSSPAATFSVKAVVTIIAIATQLTITTQPSASAGSGAPFAVQPVIQLRDAQGNAASRSGVSVTATIATGGGTLGGTTTVTTNANGTATFTDLLIFGAVGTRTLTFSAASLAGSSSGTIVVTAGAASQLTITTQPAGSSLSGVVFSQQPVLQLRDAAGNPVNQAGVVVTAALATGAGVLAGTLTAATDANGIATFTNLAITGAVGDRTLVFSAPSLSSATSLTVTITVVITLPNLTGTWVGTWTDTRYGVSGAITSVILTQTATTFSGTGSIDLYGALGLGVLGGTTTGTVSGNTVTFTFTAAGVGSGSGTLTGTSGSGSGSVSASGLGTFTFSGTATATQITGTFNFTSPTGGYGTITVIKQ